MSCNSCAKPYSLLRKEKGCPGCGFSYCSKCLDNKVFLTKKNYAAKVCIKCKKSSETNLPSKVEPPDAYYKRIGIMSESVNNQKGNNTTANTCSIDEDIANRLQKLKEGRNEIAARLQTIKGEVPTTTDAELQERLAKLREIPLSIIQSKPVLPAANQRTEQEQVEDLMKQYLEQTKIDGKYKDEFDGLVNNIESRLGKLKGSAGPSDTQGSKTKSDLEDENESVKKIVEKIKAEALLEDDELPLSTNDELPFCEICNEDARMRCVGCRYLFCKRCFMEHRDDDDECNAYEPYTPPKNFTN